MQTSISPFAPYSDKQLFEMKKDLERNISIINGTYSSPNPKFKPKPFTHMKETWMRSIELIDAEINSRKP